MLLCEFHCQVGRADLFNYIMELNLLHFILNSFTFMISSSRSAIPKLEILRKIYLNNCKWRYIILDFLTYKMTISF